MSPQLVLIMIDGALTMVEKLKPYVTAMFKQGQISVEEQVTLQNRIKALSADDAFAGPEWQPTVKS